MESPEQLAKWKRECRRLEREYPEQPKVVYLASCYHSERGEHGVDQYIHEAGILARKIWKLGLAVLCPMKNIAFFDGIDIPDTCWLHGNSEMLRRCDALVIHSNKELSEGIQEEISVAGDKGIPVFYLMERWKALAAWAKKEKGYVYDRRIP